MEISEDPVTTTHVEEALRSSEARFRALFENSYDGIALVDSDGRIMNASASTTRLIGFSHSELVGRDALELIHPEDREYVRGRLAECLTRPGEPVVAEYRVRHRDGSWRYIEGVGVNRLL